MIGSRIRSGSGMATTLKATKRHPDQIEQARAATAMISAPNQLSHPKAKFALLIMVEQAHIRQEPPPVASSRSARHRRPQARPLGLESQIVPAAAIPIRSGGWCNGPRHPSFQDCQPEVAVLANRVA